MQSHKSLASLLFAGLATVACLSGEDPGSFEFGGTSGDVACAPGRVIACKCPASADGVQYCQDDGTFGACQCESSPGSGGSGGSAGSPGSGGSNSGGICTLFPNCDGCSDCFETCVCQTSGDVPSCQSQCGVGGGGAGGGGGQCVPDQCPPAQVGNFATPCCAGNACGLSVSLLGPECIERDQPGSPDPDCPDQQLMGFPLQGCCKPNRQCGVLDSFLGLGCVDPAQFGAPPGPRC